jgi:hypothetical protein
MFTTLIFEFVNHGYNKIDIDVIVPTCYYQAWKKVQNPRMHIAHNLQVVWGLLHSATTYSISQTI